MKSITALVAVALMAAVPLAAQQEPAFRLAGEVGAEASYHLENDGSVFAGKSPFEEVSAAGIIDGKIVFSRQYTTLGLLDFTFRDANLLAHADGATLETLSFTVNELYADLNFGDLLFLRLGKQRLKWGAGFVFNPSDPVNPPKDPTATRAVREGVTALKVELINPVVSLMSFAVLYDLIEETGAGAKLSTSVITNTDLSVSAYWSASESWTTALNASVAPLYDFPGWDTLQIWVEGCLYDQARYAAYEEGLSPGAVVLGEAEGLQYSLLAGASARLPVVRTVVLAEYYRLSEGLSAAQLGAVYRALDSDNAAVAAESEAWLGELGRRPGRQGRDYLFLSVTQPTVTNSGPPVFDKIGLTATWLWNLTDLSFIASGGISTSFVEDSSLDLTVNWAHGGGDTEFGNVPSQLSTTLEVKVYF